MSKKKIVFIIGTVILVLISGCAKTFKAGSKEFTVTEKERNNGKYLVSFSNMHSTKSYLGTIDSTGNWIKGVKDSFVDLSDVNISEEFVVFSGKRRNNHLLIDKAGKGKRIAYYDEKYEDIPGSTASTIDHDGNIIATLNLGVENNAYWVALTSRDVNEIHFTEKISIYGKKIHVDNHLVDIFGFNLSIKTPMTAQILRYDLNQRKVINSITSEDFGGYPFAELHNGKYYVLAGTNGGEIQDTILIINREDLTEEKAIKLKYNAEKLFYNDKYFYILTKNGEIVKYNEQFEEIEKTSLGIDLNSMYFDYNLKHEDTLYLLTRNAEHIKTDKGILKGRIIEYSLKNSSILSETPIYVSNSLTTYSETISFIPISYFNQ